MPAAHSQQDDLAVAQNGGLVSQDNQDDGDVDADEGDLDDDMMDKISSSPSIDDGGSACQLPSLVRFAKRSAASCSSPTPVRYGEARSSSPYLDLPDHLPLQRKPTYYQLRPPSSLHHLPGGCPGTIDIAIHEEQGDPASEVVAEDLYESQSDEGSVCGDAIAATDYCPGCDHCKDDVNCSNGLLVPYEDVTDEDDEDSFLLFTDSRFIDSGWGGECLQDTEDIDFELVYALHTFIATVEGQANATKGDAMVLLDDSNSYWWLVRVVKDSSIGEHTWNSLGGIRRAGG